MPKAKRIAAGEPTRSAAAPAIDLDALLTPPPLALPRMTLPPLDDDAAIEWGHTRPEDVIAAFRKKNNWVKPEDLATAYAAFREKAALGPATCGPIIALASDDLLLEILGLPPESFIFWVDDDVEFALARLGRRAIAPLRALHAAGKIEHTAMLRIVAPFVARLAAAHLAAYVDARVRHHEWLLAHADLATNALLHTVLTDADDSVREQACAGLRFLATRDDGKRMREIAREWQVADSLDPIALPRLSPRKPSKIPKVWGDIPLPADAKGTEALLAFLASEPDVAHPWTKKVLAGLDIEALRAFVSAMMHAWTSHGSAMTHLWLIHADILAFGDAAVRRAGAWAPTKSTSSNRNERNRAGRALELLDRLESPVAIAQIADISLLAKANWLRAKAERALQVRMLGTEVDLDDVLERAMPDLGFGEGVALDYGARKFTAKARSDLSLVLVDDETGAVLDEPPRPRKSDDAKLAKSALESWRALETEAASVATVARGRLETAMRSGRFWTPERFRAHVLGHPLMRMLAQGLVWGARIDGMLATFRVAEDASLADVEDRAFALPRTPITLVHPCELSTADRDAWTARFQEYELMPPIEQLARVTFDVAPETTVAACKGWTMSPGAIFGLLRNGWKPIRDGGGAIGVDRSLGGDRKATVSFSPGFVLSEAASSELQKLGALTLSDAFVAHERARVDLSEVLRDLAGHRNPSMTSSASS